MQPARATGRTAKLAAAAVALVLLATRPEAAELTSATAAAFDRYQRAAEQAIEADLAAPDRFLRILRHDAPSISENRQVLRRGEVAIERLRVNEGGKNIQIPDGIVHHWMGTVFVPGVRAGDAVALMQDYDRHSQYFRPNVVRSKTLEHDGDRYRLFLRFFFKKVIAVTVDTDSTGLFTHHSADRVSSAIRSTRIAEIRNPDTPNERELPVGRDGGYLWRLNTYWRFLERDGGTYIECESLTLTRGIPIGLRWVIGPFVTSIPRETLTMTLRATRRALTERPREASLGRSVRLQADLVVRLKPDTTPD